ncbi:hypothetical protein GCM10027447_31270 [Glycomyces halotolerans]
MYKSRRRLPLSIHVLFAVIVALGIVYALWYLFTGSLALPSVSNPTDSEKLEIIRIVFYAVAGIGGVVALTVAYRRQRDNELAELREESRHFNERFAAATEQLSSDKVASRLSGVYAITNLADDWDQGRQICVDVLCGYLRMHYETPNYYDDHVAHSDWDAHVQMHEQQRVRRLIIDLIGERLRAKPVSGKTWHWCTFNFSSVVFDGGDFKRAKFLGSQVSFEYAHFPDGIIEFCEAEFHQGVDFAGIEVENAMVNFKDASFMGKETNFEYGSITGHGELLFNNTEFGSIKTSFNKFKFDSGEVSFFKSRFNAKATAPGVVSFSEAELSGTDIWFFEPTFTESKVDFREVADWSAPPAYGYLEEGEVLPEAILLPPESEVRILVQPSVGSVGPGAEVPRQQSTATSESEDASERP